MQNASYFSKELYDKLLTDIPKLKVITTAIVSDKLKVMGSLARKGMLELVRLGKIKLAGDHISGMSVYTRTAVKEEKKEVSKKENKKESKKKEAKAGADE